MTQQVEITFHPATLKFCRERANLTVEDVAKRMKNVTPETLIGWESGTRRPPEYHQYERLAYMYHQSTETFTKALPIEEGYSYGHPACQDKDDPCFISEEEAIHKAIKWQDEQSYDEGVLAIYHNDSGAILCLIHCGTEYRS